MTPWRASSRCRCDTRTGFIGGEWVEPTSNSVFDVLDSHSEEHT
jgi:hypothetical protein